MNQSAAAGFERRYRNILITGQCDGLSEAMTQALTTALQQIAEDLQGATPATQLRIATGQCGQLASHVRDWAQASRTPLYLAAPHLPASELRPGAGNEVCDTLFASAPAGETADLLDMTQDALLFFADAVLVVWNGEPADGPYHEIVEATRRCLPVIWLDSRAASAGNLRQLDYATLPADVLQTLQLCDFPPTAQHLTAFQPLADARSLPTYLASLWQLGSLRPLTTALTGPGPIARPRKPATWSGGHSYFFALLDGNWLARSAPAASRRPRADERAFPWPWFDRLDRAASQAANRHRDQVVLIYLFASLAVGAAIGGSIELFGIPAIIWAGLELLFILLVGLPVLATRRGEVSDHSRWLNYRQAAEGLRVSFILQPVLASLASFHTGIWRPGRDGERAPITLAKPFHWLVINLLRDIELKPIAPLDQRSPLIAARLRALLEEQITFHRRNVIKSKHTHHPLHRLVEVIFFAILLTVSIDFLAFLLLLPAVPLPQPVVGAAEWLHHQRWPLMLTGFLPALAAGLHGIDAKIELSRVAKGSEKVLAKLDIFFALLTSLESEGPPGPDSAAKRALALRRLTIQVAEVMYAEHDAWAELMADQQIEIPA